MNLTPIGPTPMNPVSRVLAVVMAVFAVVGALFFGLIVLALAVGVGLIFWLGVRLRLWWMRRHSPPIGTAPASTPKNGEVIDAEYTVISRRKD